MASDHELKLGDLAKDRVTGFQGTVIARHEYLNGCVRLSIQPNELKDGKPIESHVFDIEQLDLVEADQHKKLSRSGGPESEPARQSAPSR